MAWVAKDYIGEWIFNCKPDMWAGDCIEHNYWLPQDRYDVTTMKFEISPKLPNYERFNGLSKKYCGKEK